MHAAIVDAVRDGRLAEERLLEAAARVAAGARGPRRRAASRTAVGAEAARRALRVEGDRRSPARRSSSSSGPSRRSRPAGAPGLGELRGAETSACGGRAARRRSRRTGRSCSSCATRTATSGSASSRLAGRRRRRDGLPVWRPPARAPTRHPRRRPGEPRGGRRASSAVGSARFRQRAAVEPRSHSDRLCSSERAQRLFTGAQEPGTPAADRVFLTGNLARWLGERHVPFAQLTNVRALALAL